jgi:hypothetical protein
MCRLRKYAFSSLLLLKNLKYAVRLAADNLERKFTDETTDLLNAYLDYTFSDLFSIRAGKAKLLEMKVANRSNIGDIAC